MPAPLAARPEHSFVLAAVLCCSAALFAAFSTATAQSFDDGFRFFLPPSDTAAAPFLPAFPAQPIGEAGRVSVQGEQFVRGGAPVRFFGANLVAEGAFPPKHLADAAAGRMRKMGFNLVRFHHLDNNWGTNVFADGSTRSLDPEAMDRLMYLIYRLKGEGIYVNMNLHVSRTFTEADGVAGADSIPDFGKGVTLFDPYLVELQKEYARQLLTYENPYTGMPLADDPVLAMVEITNENSLYVMWRDGRLKPFREGGRLLARHAALLDERWHAYLREHYGTTDALREAWRDGAAGEGAELVADGGYEQSVGGRWVLEQHAGTRASVARDAADPYAGTYAARVDVAQTGENDWNIQWKQVGLSLVRDSAYTVSFALRADAPRTIHVTAQKETSPWTAWKSFAADVSAEWRTFQFSFTAPEASVGDTRLSFTVGGQQGAVWVDAVSMRRAGRVGLEEGESLEAATVRRIEAADAIAYTDARLQDLTAFYIRLQDDYFDEMASYLKDDLGVRAPLTGTNWNFGLVDLAVQSRLDYVDNHAYWDHPQFPNEPWSSIDWRIGNTPMVRDPRGGTIPRLMAGVPFAGKPYTISEYNHVFPNRYQTEGVLFLTAYGAFHSVDGLMFFEYNGGANWNADRIDGFFTLHRNTAMMALMPSCALAYRHGFISPAATTLTAHYERADVLRWPARDDGSWEGTSLFPRTLALRHRVVAGTFDHPGPTDVASFPAAPSGPYETDTGEITWDEGGLLTVGTPAFEAATGFFGEYGGTQLGAATLTSGTGFGTFTWVSLTGDPLQAARRSLLTLSSAAQNQGMVWSGTETVRSQWGTGPVEVRPLRLGLSLAVEADSLRLYALGPTGAAETFETVHPTSPGRFDLTLDQFARPTVWYGLEAFGDGLALDATRPGDVPLALDPIYPNPAAVTARVSFSLPRPGDVRLGLYDVLGRQVLERTVRASRGRHEVDLDVEGLAAGLYVCRLQVDGRSLVRTVVVR